MSGMHVVYWGNGNPLSRVGTRTRHDHVLAALRARPDVERVHYVDTGACLRFTLQPARNRCETVNGDGPHGRALAPMDVHALHNRIPFTNRFRACKRLALRVLAKKLSRAISRYDADQRSLTWWICNARFWPVLEYAAGQAHLGKTGFLDCVDHMSELWRDRAAAETDRGRRKSDEWVAREYEIGYQRAAEWAAHIAVNSRAKFEMYRRLGAAVELIPSGVDVERFAPVVEGTLNVNPALASIPTPRVGYIGPLYEMVDTELLRRAVMALPSASFVIAGNVESRESAPLEGLPNVYLLGPQTWTAIPSLMAGMDVVLSIYRRDVSAALGQSLKVIEGLAAGRTVVAVNAPLALENLEQVIRLARTDDEFIEQLRAALADPPASLELRHRRAKAVRSRSWDRVAQDILGLRSAPAVSS
jgi:glycosyltransferase involved in cell wall biosynthesis